MPTVTGKLPNLRETFRSVPERLVKRSRHRVVWTPKQAAYITVSGFLNKFQNFRRTFKTVCEAAARSKTETWTVKHLLNQGFSTGE